MAVKPGRPRLDGLAWERNAAQSRVVCRLAWRGLRAEAEAEHVEPPRAAAEATVAALRTMVGRERSLQLLDQCENHTKAGRVWLAVVGGPEGETLTGSAMGRHEVEAAVKAVLAAVNRRMAVWLPGKV
jgi:hypothetical protein